MFLLVKFPLSKSEGMSHPLVFASFLEVLSPCLRQGERTKERRMSHPVLESGNRRDATLFWESGNRRGGTPFWESGNRRGGTPFWESGNRRGGTPLWGSGNRRGGTPFWDGRAILKRWLQRASPHPRAEKCFRPGARLGRKRIGIDSRLAARTLRGGLGTLRKVYAILKFF